MLLYRLFMMTLCVFGLLLGLLELTPGALLTLRGEAADGVVTNTGVSTHRVRGLPYTSRRVAFSFRTPDGVEHASVGGVDPFTSQAYAPGQRVRVRYVPGDPRLNDFEGSSGLLARGLLMLFILGTGVGAVRAARGALTQVHAMVAAEGGRFNLKVANHVAGPVGLVALLSLFCGAFLWDRLHETLRWRSDDAATEARREAP